jgi:lysophospholipase L1-like esterase
MKYSYLALGDSYSIGEQVLLTDSFPYQTVQFLRHTADGGWQMTIPEIIATTGWTTDELIGAINAANVVKRYDIVSLLIGVNNQYRGWSVNNFKIELEQLLQMAIQFANNRPAHVFVLSIPDWGITPFAAGKDRLQIAHEIDIFNEACKTIAQTFQCNYIDITTSQREDGNKVEYLAEDGLHPSTKEYAKWAEKLSKSILKMGIE